MKIRSSACLIDPLVLDVVIHRQLVERVGHEREAVAEDVDVDVRPFADVPRADAADQPGPEPREPSHQAQGLDAHVVQVRQPLRSFVHAGQGLNLVADLAVGGQIVGTITVFHAELPGRLALGGEIFRFLAGIHQLGGLKGDLPPDTFVGHEEGCAD